MADTTSTPWEIQHLASAHDRASFDCGKPALNDWLRLRAGQHERRDVCRTYVVVKRGESVVLGYYAVSSHMVNDDRHHLYLPMHLIRKLELPPLSL